METSRSQSFFQDIRSRELNGFKVTKRSYFGRAALDFAEIGALAVDHGGEETPPLAVSFCKTSRNSHIFAVSDEDGYVSLFDSRRKFSSFACHQENAEKARIIDWVAHQNAIFDLQWIKEDKNILTASGDQTIKVWDAQEKKCIGVLMGHTGSVKSLCSHPTNSDIVVSGSRDGSFALWDLRCSTSSKRSGESRLVSSTVVNGAHLTSQAKRVRRGKAASMSITSVLCLKDEVSIATAAAVNSVVKFWDTRNLKSQVTQACPYPESSDLKDKRSHGISSLSQDLNGVFLTASCMDNRIYLYNVLQLEKGPIKSFSGCQIGSFYVKAAISPDAAHILSGSSDGNAYIWQVNKPQLDRVMLKSHDGEVTAVDWCPFETGKMATSSDDFTVRLWNIQNNSCSSKRSPSSIRRRVIAIPSAECRKLLINGELADSAKGPDNSNSSDEVVNQTNSSNPMNIPIVGTPDAKKRKLSSSDLEETFEKTPEASLKSPSSVLNPPSSVKRKTIRDYFIVSP
ncbi:denticleless protein homolog [Mangifera indica]|uniref:denticleless protein homolog n=1 Tax=Mangifera indica TaxID=29780 RepID=UPI001CFA0D74|nr:denticleless protein homolog [Mangifera indica]